MYTVVYEIVGYGDRDKVILPEVAVVKVTPTTPPVGIGTGLIDKVKRLPPIPTLNVAHGHHAL